MRSVNVGLYDQQICTKFEVDTFYGVKATCFSIVAKIGIFVCEVP